MDEMCMCVSVGAAHTLITLSSISITSSYQTFAHVRDIIYVYVCIYFVLYVFFVGRSHIVIAVVVMRILLFFARFFPSFSLYTCWFNENAPLILFTKCQLSDQIYRKCKIYVCSLVTTRGMWKICCCVYLYTDQHIYRPYNLKLCF